MMLPAFLLIGVGENRRFWIPLPLVLLWPFWLLGWLLWIVLLILGIPWAKPLKVALQLAANLSGFRVDVDTADGEHVHVRMI
jgi:hypothetical protein